MSESSCGSVGAEPEEEEEIDSFYDAPDELSWVDDTSGLLPIQSPLVPDTKTLTSNDQFSTCKGDTLKDMADENFIANSRQIEIYDDTEADDDDDDNDSWGPVANDSVGSENHENEMYDYVKSNSSSNDAEPIIGKNRVKKPLSKQLSNGGMRVENNPQLIVVAHSKDNRDEEYKQELFPSSLYPNGNNVAMGTNGNGFGFKGSRRRDHLSLDNLNSIVTSDSGTSFTPEYPEHLPVPMAGIIHSSVKTNSLPSDDRGVPKLPLSPCDLFKTFDKNYLPTEDSASDHSESTNTTQETRSSKRFAIKSTSRRILTGIKARKFRGSKNRDSANLETSGSYTSGAENESKGGTMQSEAAIPHLQHIPPSYPSDNYPDDREKNFSKSTTIVQTIESHQHNLAIWCLKFSSCGKYLAAAGQDKTIRVWILRCEFESLGLMNSTTNLSRNLSPTSANMHLLSYSSQKSLEGSLKNKSEDSSGQDNLDLSPFLPEPYRIFSKHSSDVMDISWSTQNSSYLLSASMDKNVRLWHIHMNKCLGAFDHQNIVTCVTFPPKEIKTKANNVFLSGAMDGKVRIWSITEKKVLTFYEASGGKKQPITSLCYSNSGDYILVGTLSGQILKLDSVQLSLVSQTRILSSKSSKLRRNNVKIVSIQESPRSPENFLVSSSDCRIYLFDAAAATSSQGSSNNSLEKLSGSNGAFWRQKAKYKGHSNKNSPIRTGFSRLGNFIISGSECKGIFIWNTEPLDSKLKNTIFECIQAHEVSVTAATFSPTVEAIKCLDSCQRKVEQQQLEVLAMRTKSESPSPSRGDNHKMQMSTNCVTTAAAAVTATNQLTTNNSFQLLTPNITNSMLDKTIVNSGTTLGAGVESAAAANTNIADNSQLQTTPYHSYSERFSVVPTPNVNHSKHHHPLTNYHFSSFNTQSHLQTNPDELRAAATESYLMHCENVADGSCSQLQRGTSHNFTVKNLIVGEVFASADYTGKINIYFA